MNMRPAPVERLHGDSYQITRFNALLGAMLGFAAASTGPLMLVMAQQLMRGRAGLASGLILGIGFVTGKRRSSYERLPRRRICECIHPRHGKSIYRRGSE